MFYSCLMTNKSVFKIIIFMYLGKYEINMFTYIPIYLFALMKKCNLCVKLCTIFLFVNVGTMDKSKLIASDKYQNAHGCKVVTSNDDSKYNNSVEIMYFIR